MEKHEIEKLLAENGLTLKSQFVPFSKSRNAGEKSPSLNWKVTLLRDKREVLTTDYMTGCGHCPSYKPWGRTIDPVVIWECENGKTGRYMVNTDHVTAKNHNPILPDLPDVLYSLILDSEAIDNGTFEDWADSFGYDRDSRKGEAIYRQCLEIGFKLRAGLGNALLLQLQEAFQDY